MEIEVLEHLKKLAEEQSGARRRMIAKHKEFLRKRFKYASKEEVIDQLAITKTFYLELRNLLHKEN